MTDRRPPTWQLWQANGYCCRLPDSGREHTMSFPSRRAKSGIVLGIVLWVFVDLAYFLAGGFWFTLGYLIGIYLLLFGLAWHISRVIEMFRASSD
jgi:hypothetical protein